MWCGWISSLITIICCCCCRRCFYFLFYTYTILLKNNASKYNKNDVLNIQLIQGISNIHIHTHIILPSCSVFKCTSTIPWLNIFSYYYKHSYTLLICGFEFNYYLSGYFYRLVTHLSHPTPIDCDLIGSRTSPLGCCFAALRQSCVTQPLLVICSLQLRDASSMTLKIRMLLCYECKILMILFCLQHILQQLVFRT